MEAKENLNNRSAKVKKSARAAKLFVFFDGNTLEYPLAGTMTVGRPTSSSTPDLEIDSPIVIGNNVWIAAGVIVCAGVTIGDNSVIGAGSVVTRNIPSNVFACGVPCRVVRTITEDDIIEFDEMGY